MMHWFIEAFATDVAHEPEPKSGDALVVDSASGTAARVAPPLPREEFLELATDDVMAAVRSTPEAV